MRCSVHLCAGSALIGTLVGCGPEPAFMEATIDGMRWEAENITCIARSNPSALEVVASRTLAGDTARFVRLLALTPSAPSTVPLGETGGPRAVISDGIPFGDATTTFSTTDEFTGTAIVTEFDAGGDRCSGTFAFTAVTVFGLPFDTVEVTGGSWMTSDILR